MSGEKLTAIIGIRVFPSFKSQLKDEAIATGKTLSEYIYRLIELGWERFNEEGVKQNTQREIES